MCQENCKILRNFRTAKIGQMVWVNLNCLKPSQPDDGYLNLTEGPLDVCEERGNDRCLMVVHGNHRFYEQVRNVGRRSEIEVKKTQNPYSW